jgi:23S rRNA (cytidine1920-2'-O)/16S rRNA (cytidine1409-2'-O)-methyltransferase
VKRRLDQILVDRNLAATREKAQALILAGQVLVDGQPASKPGHAYDDSARVELIGQLPFVSRGGVKLAAALDHWRIDPAGWVCLDVGASTGGFTDCLLQRGAARVHAVDVGPSQLDWKIRSDPRVVVHERTNARYLTPSTLGESVRLAVCDVAFISATLIIPALTATLAPRGQVVILVKPQFESERRQVGKGGIVRDPAVQLAACARVRACLEAHGFRTETIDSPIAGAEGNREFLMHGTR